MAAPAKPWERPCCVNRQNDNIQGTNFMSSNPMTGAAPSPFASAQPLSGQPPPLPARPSVSSSYSRLGYGGYGSMYGSGYGSMYSSPYSSYGSYGTYGMNRYGGMGMEQGGTFARQAEESSRPAFESIESIVNAFTSVSMMLDSTFQAVYNSFRAVIGVADYFSKLKVQLMQVFSALAFIRTLKYIYRRILETLRLRPPGTAVAEWNKAFAAAAKSASSQDPGARKTSWPILMFFGIILGGPWLIWKLISSFTGTAAATPGWAEGQDDHFVADVLYDFTAQSTEEISLQAGSKINVAPKELQPRVRGWLLASGSDGKTGLIPANYVKVLGKRRGSKTMVAVNQPGLTADPNPIFATESSMNLSQRQQTIPENEMESSYADVNLESGASLTVENSTPSEILSERELSNCCKKSDNSCTSSAVPLETGKTDQG